MGEIQKYSLKDSLLKADKELNGSLSILGMSGMTASGHINAMRTTMFTAHLKQFVNLVHPEPPRIFTGMEKLVGEFSDGYKILATTKGNSKVYYKTTAEGDKLYADEDAIPADYEVLHKIVKFEGIVKKPMIYSLIVRNKKTGEYDIVTRMPVEDLTENFGYLYNNDVIDSYEEGDEIPKGTVLYRSTSYDDDMVYSYGVNAHTGYTLNPFTSEDAAVVSESFARRCESVSSETYSINMNDNDYLLNIFGDKKTYKVFPDIGEKADDILCALRRLESSQLLFDFKDRNLKTIMDQDKVYSLDDTSEVIDITIYNNNDELEETPFTKQIMRYYRSQTKYYRKIYEICKKIVESGEPFSQDIDYALKRSSEMIDTDKKWKEGDSAFSNMVIKIHVLQRSGLRPGQKITGRCGNKSVISKILPDSEMPYVPLTDKNGDIVYDDNGNPVVKYHLEVLENLLGIINRTTSSPLQELMETSINEQIIEYMRSLKSYKEREVIFFDALYIYNEKEYAQYKKIYDSRDHAGKKKFIDDVMEQGMYIHDQPLWSDTATFFRIDKLLKRFDFLKPSPLFVNRNGIAERCLRDVWPGQMYIMKLKQSDRRGFSGRATGAINSRELPTRSYKSRSHLERVSGTAIRFGEFETLNFLIGIVPEDVAMFHGYYRTSVKGRKDIIRVMFDPEHKEKKIDRSYTSRTAEIFNVIMKTLSIEVEINDDKNDLKVLDNKEIKEHTIGGKTYLCTDYEAYVVDKVLDIVKEVLNKNPVMTEDALISQVKEEIKSTEYIVGPSVDEFVNTTLIDDIVREYYKK